MAPDGDEVVGEPWRWLLAVGTGASGVLLGPCSDSGNTSIATVLPAGSAWNGLILFVPFWTLRQGRLWLSFLPPTSCVLGTVVFSLGLPSLPCTQAGGWKGHSRAPRGHFMQQPQNPCSKQNLMQKRNIKHEAVEMFQLKKERGLRDIHSHLTGQHPSIPRSAGLGLKTSGSDHLADPFEL